MTNAKTIDQYYEPCTSRQQRTTELIVNKRSEISSHTNFRYLTPKQQIKRISNLRKEIILQRHQIETLKTKIHCYNENGGIFINSFLERDLETIMNEMNSTVTQSHPSNSFQRLFWEQQLQAVRNRDNRQVRWHPAMIKWCLNLKLLSSSSYHALRSSGVMILPSERTLRDYTHWIKAQPGLSDAVDDQLMTQAQITVVPEYMKHICLLFDEVYIKEDLVYNKNTSEIIGFVDLGDVNNQLLQMERSDTKDAPRHVATKMMVFMVRGIFSNLEFPYAQYPCASLSADTIFPIAWNCIAQLETCGFKVMALTGDGASCNRKFFKMHQTSEDFVHKTANIYSSDNHSLYFFSDVPHLIKTVRNCWANSFAHSHTRKLQVCKAYI